MPTNYFAVEDCPSPCAHCNGYTYKHLGKSSAGWQFAYRLPSDINLDGEYKHTAYQSWIVKVLEANHIEDETGRVYTKAEFIALASTLQGRSNSEEFPGEDVFSDDAGRSWITVDFA